MYLNVTANESLRAAVYIVTCGAQLFQIVLTNALGTFHTGYLFDELAARRDRDVTTHFRVVILSFEDLCTSFFIHMYIYRGTVLLDRE